MTEVQAVPQSSIDADIVSGVAQFLGPVVVDLTALAVDGKQAHWHVRGANFQAVHELLDEVVEHAHEYADTAAERVVALGLPLDVRIQTVGRTATNPPLTAGFQQSDATIAQIIASIDATLVTVRTAVEELGLLDAVSQDVAIEIARGLEKDRWFLFAHLCELTATPSKAKPIRSSRARLRTLCTAVRACTRAKPSSSSSRATAATAAEATPSPSLASSIQ
jgi:starvation-inducible DNA-binding protein